MSRSEGVKEQQKRQWLQYINRWLNGLEDGMSGTNNLSRHIKRYLLEIHNNTCSECGWNKRHPTDNLPLVEIDHIDGDCTNNIPSNLRVLCPNCHSFTPYFRNSNIESTRGRYYMY